MIKVILTSSARTTCYCWSLIELIQEHARTRVSIDFQHWWFWTVHRLYLYMYQFCWINVRTKTISIMKLWIYFVHVKKKVPFEPKIIYITKSWSLLQSMIIIAYFNVAWGIPIIPASGATIYFNLANQDI